MLSPTRRRFTSPVCPKVELMQAFDEGDLPASARFFGGVLYKDFLELRGRTQKAMDAETREARVKPLALAAEVDEGACCIAKQADWARSMFSAATPLSSRLAA